MLNYQIVDNNSTVSCILKLMLRRTNVCLKVIFSTSLNPLLFFSYTPRAKKLAIYIYKDMLFQKEIMFWQIFKNSGLF